MVLPTSGPLSLNDIHIEATGTSGTTVTINDADLRALTPGSGKTINPTSGTLISIDDFYGASFLADKLIRFEIRGGSGGDCGTSSYPGGNAGETIYSVEAQPGTGFQLIIGEVGSGTGNFNQGAGGGAGSAVYTASYGQLLAVAGGGGGGGYDGVTSSDGGLGGGGNGAGGTGLPGYPNGGGNGGSAGVGGDESSTGIRWAAQDGQDYNGTSLYGRGGGGGEPSATGGMNNGGGNTGYIEGGAGGDNFSNSDGGTGGGGGGYGGGAGGAVTSAAGQGSGGGGGGGYGRTSGLSAGYTYVSVTGTQGGFTGTNGNITIYVDGAFNSSRVISGGQAQTFTVP